MYAASNGAKLVYAVEASEVAILAQKLVKENGMDNIKVIQGTIESVKLPEKVDVIISEWMGFYLVHEGMLSSLIYARENFLKPDGIIFPNRADLFAAPVDLSQYFKDNFGIYDSVDGFSMKALKGLLWNERLKSPLCDTVDPGSIQALASSVVNWKLDDLCVEDLEEISQTTKFDIKTSGVVHGLAFWFSVSFQSENFCSVLDTSPYLTETHWKQTSVFLPKFTNVDKGDSLIVEIELKKSDVNPRWYDISLNQKNLQSKSFTPVECDVQDESVTQDSECCVINGDEESDDAMDDVGGDVIAALIGALSEKYDADPSEIAQVIVNGDSELTEQ